MLLVGLFFAAAIQNVKIKELNDSNIIAGSVYCIAAISAVLTFIGFFLNDKIDVQYIIIGGFMMLTVTVILCVIFVPMVSTSYHHITSRTEFSFSQIKALFEDPAGELKKQNVVTDSGSLQNANRKQRFTPDQDNHIRSLNNELYKLRNELSQLKVNNPTVNIPSS